MSRIRWWWWPIAYAALPFLARIPGTCAYGSQWFADYFGPSPLTWGLAACLSAIPGGAIALLRNPLNSAIRIALPVAVSALIVVTGHASLPASWLSMDSLNGVAFLTIPFVATVAAFYSAALVGFVLVMRRDRTPNDS